MGSTDSVVVVQPVVVVAVGDSGGDGGCVAPPVEPGDHSVNSGLQSLYCTNQIPRVASTKIPAIV